MTRKIRSFFTSFYRLLEAKPRLQFNNSAGKCAGCPAEIRIRIVAVINARAVGCKTKRSQIKIVKGIEKIKP
jgi:hypothetical protein